MEIDKNNHNFWRRKKAKIFFSLFKKIVLSNFKANLFTKYI